MRRTLAAALLLLALPLSAEEAPMLTIETIADGVFAFIPTEDAIDSWRAVSNSGAVILDDGVLIFDSHWTPFQVEAARKLLRAHTDKPIRYVVNSHYHGDHTGGAWAYGDVELITHHATRDRLVEYYEELPSTLPDQVARQEERLEQTTDADEKARLANIVRYSRDLLTRIERGDPVPLPSLTFEEKVVVHRGRKVEVYFLGRGHTDGDAIVFLPEEKVAFLGDLLWTRGLPNVRDGFTREWIETLEKALDLGATRFVPGHGRLATAEDVRVLIGLLRWLREVVEPFVHGGKTVDEAKDSIELPPEYADYRFPWHLPMAIEKVFGEIEAGQ